MDSQRPFVYSDPEWSKDDPKEIAIKFIPENAETLDVGCGIGSFGLWLKLNKNCRTSGIDGHPEAVKVAKKNLDKADLIDLNQLDEVKKFGAGKSFDVITFIDVLEHCHHPKELLEIFGSALSDDGKIIVSLPNIAHYSARLRVVKGNFDYDKSGLFDTTHVRFYTKKTSRELLESAGFKVERVSHTTPSRRIPQLLSKLDATLTAIQFVYVASPSK